MWAAIAFAQALAQTRFVNGLAVPYAIVTSAACVALVRSIDTRLSGRPRSVRALVFSGAVAVAAFALAPSADFIRDLARVIEVGPIASVRSTYREALVYRGVAQWLGDTLSGRGGEAFSITLCMSIVAIVLASLGAAAMSLMASRALATPEPFLPASGAPSHLARLGFAAGDWHFP